MKSRSASSIASSSGGGSYSASVLATIAAARSSVRDSPASRHCSKLLLSAVGLS